MFEEIVILSLSFASVVFLVLSISRTRIGPSCGRTLDVLGHYLSKLNIEKHREKVKNQLISARIHRKFAQAESQTRGPHGVPTGFTPDTFLSLQLVCGAVSFSIASLVISGVSIGSVIIGCAGFWLPAIWLNQRVARRHRAIRQQLPYFVDLFTLSVEAGLDFGSSLNRILEKTRGGALQEEFSTMLGDITMGKTRRQAMEAMRKRVNLQDLSSLIGALIQADTFGTSLGKMLRIQSEELRRKRSERAEKLAMQAPVKMLLPLIGFIFPAVFIVLLGPILLQLLSGRF